ncbi:MAG: TonB-dependent receptor [Bacteroidales bacterium]|nr:TonB-dependent receptor [Bacteroidales bacterium]
MHHPLHFLRHILSLILISLLLSANVLAQSTIKGVVYDEKNGEAVPFANIILQGTTLGAVSDINGLFIINRVPKGQQLLRVSCVGYQDYEDSVRTDGRSTVSLNIQLHPSVVTIKAVEVKSGRKEERKQSAQVSMEKIKPTQILQMPSIGGQADIAQYMQVLPGVSSTGDQGGQLYIRGGSMIQNLCLLDGMVIYNPFHSIGLYSIFETDVIHNADIYTGGFGAEYGGRLSSVMDITTRDGNKRRHTGKLSLTTFGAGAILEGPFKRETNTDHSSVTYLLTAKGSLLSRTAPVIYPYVDGGLPFDFLDLYGKLSANTGTGSKASIFGFRFDDRVPNYQAIADYHWTNVGAGANFVLMPGSSSILEGTLAYSNYQITLEDISAKPKYSSIGSFNMNLAVTNFIGRSKLKAGIAMEAYATDFQSTNIYGIMQSQNEHTEQIAAYATYHMSSGRWLIDPGLRFTYYASLFEPSLEPRIAIKYSATDQLRFKLAGGLYSQILLDARSDGDIVNLFNGFLTGSGYLDRTTSYRGQEVESCVQRATHIVVGAEYDAIPHLTLNAEWYLKYFSQLLGMNAYHLYNASDPAYRTGGIFEKPQSFMHDFIIERGTATGLDLSLCYDAERLYLWATYSLGFVQRKDDMTTYWTHYDRRHTVNLMATYALGDNRQWEFSGRWSLGSGFPYTQTLGIFERLPLTDFSSDYWRTNGTYGIYYGTRNAGRMPWYHRLDLSAKRKFSIGKNGLLEVSAGITNVYNRNNIFYVERLSGQQTYQLPIMVNAGLNYKF